ncbi:hypothetical protein PVMG_02556 [Plasmodium vivax Mauritania I]|uniref:VIR protein n=1 Tax=Plasmodium vivax Mauritania I TaxID=1035515 RepID=A0A0J9TIV2_PLAVI|nr:hypothetical protein PVMG_02556 [Plasmodium vivax Mauritania I]
MLYIIINSYYISDISFKNNIFKLMNIILISFYYSLYIKELISKLYIIILIHLNYKCYSILKSCFDESTLTESGQKIFNRTIEKLNKVSRSINSNKNIFKELAKYLTRDHAFSTYGNPVSCMYINFWLKEEIQKSYNYEYGSNLHLFDQFATIFATERANEGYYKNLCKININEIVDDVYRKKQILYKLYDLYTEHKITPNDKTIEKLCANINLILNVSRGAYDYIKEDKKFEKVIKELMYLIQEQKPHKNKCDYSILKNMLPKEDPKPIVERPVMPVGNSIVTDPLSIPQTDDLKDRVEEISGEDETALSATELLPQKTELQEVPSFAPVILLEGAQELQPLAVLSGGTTHSRFPEGDRLHTPRPQAATILEHESELRPTSDDLLVDTQHARSYERGVLGSIQHTLTEVLGSVEPAPVLGVSGGMGALFLLFKVLKTKF